MAYDDDFQAARDGLVSQAVQVQKMTDQRGLKDEKAACEELLAEMVAAQINHDIEEQSDE